MPLSFAVRFALLSLALCLSPGCTPATIVPLRTVTLGEPGAAQKPALLVFLPGRSDLPESFAFEGFAATAREAGVAADMIAVDAHIGYYYENSVVERLRDDVIGPARRRGYGEIWLVGISMGGMGAIWYDAKCPGDVTGVVLLAPYLGEEEVVGEITRAGGLSRWDRPEVGTRDYQRGTWHMLKNYEVLQNSRHRVYLGYGRDDRFAFANGLLAAVLPGDQVVTRAGGHDWPTWRLLWGDILRKSVLAARARNEKTALTPDPLPAGQ